MLPIPLLRATLVLRLIDVNPMWRALVLGFGLVCGLINVIRGEPNGGLRRLMR